MLAVMITNPNFAHKTRGKREATGIILDTENPGYERRAQKQTNLSTEAFGLTKKVQQGIAWMISRQCDRPLLLRNMTILP